jgi:hypothetical protein
MDLSDCAFKAGAVAPALRIHWFYVLHAVGVSIVLDYHHRAVSGPGEFCVWLGAS